MKTLKEMKAAMMADEMKYIVGGTELVDAVNPDWIDDDPANKVKSVISDCPSPSSQPTNCQTISGFRKWLGDWINILGCPVYNP
jgi:hypothetical protein